MKKDGEERKKEKKKKRKKKKRKEKRSGTWVREKIKVINKYIFKILLLMALIF